MSPPRITRTIAFVAYGANLRVDDDDTRLYQRSRIPPYRRLRTVHNELERQAGGLRMGRLRFIERRRLSRVWRQ